MKKALVLVTTLVTAVYAHSFDVDAKYKQSCAACHSSGVAGAPKAFDEAAWKPRLATGMDALVETVVKGKGAMPPKGLCNDCTPDQYKALINHMAKAQ